MKTLKQMSTTELLTSFNNGQGKTVDLPTFANVDNGTITYNGLTANVTQSWLEAFTLMQLHKDLKDAPSDRQAKLFAKYNEGALSLNHTLGEAKKPLSNHHLTSDEYLTNVIRLSATFDNMQSILELVNTAISNTKITKDDMVTVLNSVKDIITPIDKIAVFNELAVKEQAFNSVKSLLESQVESITVINDISFKISVKPVSMDNVVSIADNLNYNVEKADFDLTTKLMTIEFKQR